MPQVKSWNNKLKIETYSDGAFATIQIVDNETREFIGGEVGIPLQILYRLHYMGRAYDFQTMKLLKPNGNQILDWTNMTQLKGEIQYLLEAIRDPVIIHYVRPLMLNLELTTNRPKSHLIYNVG